MINEVISGATAASIATATGVVAALSRPAILLIEKTFEVIHGYTKPYQEIMAADAAAKALVINAQAKIEVDEMKRRAIIRRDDEETVRQKNMESITNQACRLLTDEATPEKIKSDWIANFFDKCRIVSDEQMQQIWSSVLAGEANSPGAFSKRTVNIVADMDTTDANSFSALCNFAMTVSGVSSPIVFDWSLPIYKSNGISFASLALLKSAGLIQLDSVAQFTVEEIYKTDCMSYQGVEVALEFPQLENNIIDVGTVLFTDAGLQLSRVCAVSKIEGFLDFVCDQWSQMGVIVKQTSEVSGTTPAP